VRKEKEDVSRAGKGTVRLSYNGQKHEKAELLYA
jgi:hypothetical protein